MLHLYASDKVEPLAERLAEVYSVAPADPMTPEALAVPSVGMQRWLSLELARHLGASGDGSSDGIAANIEFSFPNSLRQRLLQAGRPPESPDPWEIARLTWAVLESADRHPQGLPTSLTSSSPGVSRYGAARKMADLFDRYHVHRPAMIREWANGRAVDAIGRVLPSPLHWQPELWRLCRARVGEPSPAERLPALLDALRAGQLDIDLPDRVALFGLTTLPGGASFLELAEAMASGRDVHVFLLEPSTGFRQRLNRSLSDLPPSGVRLRSEDESRDLVDHPLLRSWGRLHRETAVLLTDASRRGLPPPSPIGGDDQSAPRRSLLAELQADIRASRPPRGSRVPDPNDRSIQLHACYGPTRQVEVVRDSILHLLADPVLDLCEDEIVVLCPALDQFAPLIEGVFGPSVDSLPGDRVTPRNEGPALRYRIADRSLRTTNPLLGAMTSLIELVGSRFNASAVLDFAALVPVRQRFGFHTDDLARFDDWVDSTNVRWGIDSRHRLDFDVPAAVDSNTWQAGLDRLLVGIAVHNDNASLAVGGVVPYDTEGDDVVLAGRLAELIGTLAGLQHKTGTRRPIAAWVDLLRTGAFDLFAPAPDLNWQSDALHGVLQSIAANATVNGVGSPTLVSFADLRRILDVELRSAPGRPDFFRGGVTITSMTPLRGIPYRVVCLLGMDQTAFSPGTVDSDDLAAWAQQLGDRDPRGDLRSALLEAVLAAGDCLLVVRNGHDVRTNHEVPPPVVVAELVDTLVAMVDPDHRKTFAACIETDHPRQAFDVRCFEPGLRTGGPWSFDTQAYAGALARRSRAVTEPETFLSKPLSPFPSEEIDLADLRRFFRHPVKTFLEDRLGVQVPRVESKHDPVVPLSFRGLDEWHAGDRLLTALTEGRSEEEWSEVETRLGLVPPGVLAEGELERVRSQAFELLDAALARGFLVSPGRPVSIDISLADGTRLTGSVMDQLRPPGRGPCELGYSRVKPVRQVIAWLDLMALAAAYPAEAWRSVAVGRGNDKKESVKVIELAPVGEARSDARLDAARAALGTAVDLYRHGMAEPIPLFASFSHSVANGKAARSKWMEYSRSGDGDDVANALVFGRYDYYQMMELPRAEGDPEGPDSRVECYARCLWDAVTSSTVDLSDRAPTNGETP